MWSVISNWLFGWLIYVSPRLVLKSYLAKMTRAYAKLSESSESIRAYDTVIQVWLASHKTSARYESISKLHGVIQKLIPIIERTLKEIEFEARKVRLRILIDTINLNDANFGDAIQEVDDTCASTLANFNELIDHHQSHLH